MKDCIDSIRLQNHKDWELIAVNDHSTDVSKAIIESYRDSRINVLENEGSGILPALQTAEKHLEGAFVTRMDADDIMPQNKLTALLKILVQKTNGVIATGTVKYFSSNNVSEGYRRYERWLNETANKQLFYKRIYRECVVASPNWMMRRSDFDIMNGFSLLTYPEDYDMVFHWRKHGFKIESCNECTHYWREHEDRISRNSKTYQQESFFRLKLGYFLQEFKEKDINLLGTEKKGILLAKMLQEQKIPFRWFTNVLKLVGQKKHDIILENISTLPPTGVCISSIYPNKKQREDLECYLKITGYELGDNAHFF